METTETGKDSSIPDYERGWTFEKFWAAMHELDKRDQEKTEQFHRELKESSERFLKELKASTAELDKKLGFFGNRFGEMIEYMASPGLKEKFRTYGFTFNVLSHDAEITLDGRIIAELDMLLENGDSVVVVEMKSKPDNADIREHVERMDKLRAYADGKGDKRKYYGAMGGIIFDENIRNYALKCGFFVIEPSGESFNLVAPEGDNKPRAW